MLLEIAQIHKKIISIYETFDNLNKIQKSKHTVFWWQNQAISYIAKYEKKVTIGFHKGYLIDKDFCFAKSCSKYIRHLHFISFDKNDEKILKEIINESISHSIELEEKKKFKQQFKGI